MNAVRLKNLNVGDLHPCVFVAEIGGMFKNFNEVKRLIDSAIEIGINAIKFQTLEAETITTKNNYFDLEVTGHVSQYDFFKKFEPSKDLQIQIMKYANDCGIIAFSAPSHIKDLELMERMNVPIYKIGSDLACHIPLLKKVAQFQKPIILSTGMCTLQEVKESVDAILSSGNNQIILLHCVSDYPAKIEESNLNAITTMKKKFNLPTGYSDHTIGLSTSFAAAILGANIIEKHFKHPHNDKSADDIHALNPDEFKMLINSVRDFERSGGTGEKNPTDSEKKYLYNNRVSIISLVNIKKGDMITKELIDVRRPGTGIQPKYFDQIIGKIARIDIEKETPITWDVLS